MSDQVDEHGHPYGPFGPQPRGSLKQTVQMFNTKADETQKKIDKNPYSDTYQRPEYKVTDERYGRPEQGSLTEKRSIAAGQYIFREILFLCEVINKYGKEQPDGTVTITFGLLFDLYSTYSESLVGMLLRGRKHGLLNFVGEMLYQRQDEKVVITMLKPLKEIQEKFLHSGDPVRCVAQKS